MQSKQRLLIVSPHLDDAILSCGLLLAAHPGAVVCTVFTASPEHNMSTDWDLQSGFNDAFEAMKARKTEDLEALETLHARPVHLPFCDAQYQSTPSPELVANAIERTIIEVAPSTLMVPLGLFHSDHVLVADACLSLLRRSNDMHMSLYEEVPYRRMPGVVQDRMRVLAERGFLTNPDDTFDNTRLTGADAAINEQLKDTAIHAYQSQLRAFGPDGQAGLHSAERYWHIRFAADREPTTRK